MTISVDTEGCTEKKQNDNYKMIIIKYYVLHIYRNYCEQIISETVIP